MSSTRLHRALSLSVAATVAITAYLYRTPEAAACGCFTPPDPSVPIVQAGERIAFAQTSDGMIISHIQIQYSGPAEEFGWLLPLPSEPEPLQLGVDELFAQLVATTQPKYILDREYVGDCPFAPGGSDNTSADPSSGGDGDGDGDGGGGPLVLQDSVGPFDYAVLRADSKEPMLQWLAENRFFVPAGTDQAVDPYIRPNAYFLALKLRKGNDVGDIQPVVVKYKSDLPMIPLVLTSVAADPNMGVMVWVLGEHRAIPRNYNHTRINDAAIDWLNLGENYVDVISAAVNDAQGGTSFVTEYAGLTLRMRGLLDWNGRFGSVSTLKATNNAVRFVEYLVSAGYLAGGQFPSALMAILQRELPVPAGLLAQGITPADYYLGMAFYTGWYREENPELFEDLDLEFDPAAVGDEIEARIVVPTLEAGQLFRDYPYMTRLFTTLDPSEMVRDPVFSYNPDLPDHDNEHRGRLIYYCGTWGDNDDANTTPARLITEDGWELSLPDGTANNPWTDVTMPQSRYTEILREEGEPTIVWDRSAEIRDALGRGTGAGGCSVAGAGGGLAGLALLGLALALAVRRTR